MFSFGDSVLELLIDVIFYFSMSVITAHYWNANYAP